MHVYIYIYILAWTRHIYMWRFSGRRAEGLPCRGSGRRYRLRRSSGFRSQFRQNFDRRGVWTIRPTLPARSPGQPSQPECLVRTSVSSYVRMSVCLSVSHQPSAFTRQPSAVSCQPSAVSRQPLGIGRQPSACSRSHQSPAVNRQPSAGSRQLLAAGRAAGESPGTREAQTKGLKFAPSWSKLAPSRAKFAPSWPQAGPRWPQAGPRWPQAGPSWPKLDPSWAKLTPSGHQAGSNLTPSWSQTGQGGSSELKKAKEALEESPKRPDPRYIHQVSALY